MELVLLPLTICVSIALVKVRCTWRGGCLSCAFNDQRMALGPLMPEEGEWSPADSQATLPLLPRPCAGLWCAYWGR